MIINEVELNDLDLADLEVAEQFEKEFSECSAKIENANGTRAKIIKETCNAIFNLFDNLFGNGTAKKVFGEKTNIIICNKALAKLVDEAHRIDERNAQITNEIFQKYNPDRTLR